ncbi:MAG: YdcF family protein [Deltaproteobacteria bacterium]|nr:YdcF family protein [Deltaproteobacteria bacterium]
MDNKANSRGLALVAALVASYIIYLFSSFIGDVRAIDAIEARGKADAIVVLTGGLGRTEVGLKLLSSGTAGLMILSGVHEDAELESIFFNKKLSENDKLNIILEKKSRSTIENAIEVRRIFEEKGYRSMVLITSAYHMKRALYLFRRIMPDDYVIMPYSVDSPNFDETRWWGSRSLGLLTVEFLKFYWYAAGFGLGVYDF